MNDEKQEVSVEEIPSEELLWEVRDKLLRRALSSISEGDLEASGKYVDQYVKLSTL